jgi:hypothetical protein
MLSRWALGNDIIGGIQRDIGGRLGYLPYYLGLDDRTLLSHLRSEP